MQNIGRRYPSPICAAVAVGALNGEAAREKPKPAASPAPRKES